MFSHEDFKIKKITGFALTIPTTHPPLEKTAFKEN